MDRNHSMFGDAVAVDGDRALVAVSSNPDPLDQGGYPYGAVWSVDLANFPATTQLEFGRPYPPPAYVTAAPFGRPLELVGDIAVLGAFNEDNLRGALYVYNVADANHPRLIQRIPAPTSTAQRWGISLAFDGRTILAGDSFGEVHMFQVTVPEPASQTLAAIGAMTALRRRSCRLRGSFGP